MVRRSSSALPVIQKPEKVIVSPSEEQMQQQSHQGRLLLEQQQQLGQDQNPPQGQDLDTVFMQLQQQHTACMRVFRLYYEALFTSIRSLHLSERSCLPPWEPPRVTRRAPNCKAPQQECLPQAPSEDVTNAAEALERGGIVGGTCGVVAWECQRGRAERLPQTPSTGQCARTGGMWDELGGHPRAMVEFEMELVHNNRNRLLQTLESTLNQLELYGANATRLIERSLALQQQQAQVQLGEEDHASVLQLQRAEDHKRRQQQHSVLQREIVETLIAESELWKRLEATSQQLDREAPLLGGFPIRLIRGPDNTLLPANYVMPRILFPPGRTQQAAASATPDASWQAELRGLPVVPPVAKGSKYHANTPLEETSIVEVADASANASAPRTSTAAPAASPTESEAANESALTRKTAAPSGAPASMDGAAVAADARASDPATVSSQSRRASAVERKIATAAIIAAARASAEPTAVGVDQADNASSSISASAAMRRESAASTATDDFAFRSFPGPIVVQNPLVQRLPCRRLGHRRQLPSEDSEEADECQGPVVGRPGYTVIRLPLWMQRQPPNMAHSLHDQQQQLQQQELGQQDSRQHELEQEQEQQQQELITGQLDAMRILEEMLQRRDVDGAVLDFHNELERQQGSLSAECSTTILPSLYSMLSVSPRSVSTNTESPPTIIPGRPPTEGES
ncbi:hypothetical protein Esti_002269 [Eimeria stiedai]